MTSYLFVDGAYLTRRFKEWGELWFDEAAAFNPTSLSYGFDRTFYYDAITDRMDGESEDDYKSRVAQKTSYFDFLRSFAGWHVSEGTSRRRGTGKKERVHQKEVDIMIAVDMLTHTHRKNAGRLGFVAGDLDFRPLLEAVVRDGMYVELIYDPVSIADGLKHAADDWRELRFFQMYALCAQEFRQKFKVPGYGLGIAYQPPVQSIEVARCIAVLGGETTGVLFKTPRAQMSPEYQLLATRPRGEHEFPQLSGSDPDMLMKLHVHLTESGTWVDTAGRAYGVGLHRS